MRPPSPCIKPLPVYTRVGSTRLLFLVHQQHCVSVPPHLPHYLFTCQPIYSFRPADCLLLSLSTYHRSLSLLTSFWVPLIRQPIFLYFPSARFAICLHLAPPKLAVCREKCLARVNGSAVNTSEHFCSALSAAAAAAPFCFSEHAHTRWARPQLEQSRLNVWDEHRSSIEAEMNTAPFKRSVQGADESTARIFTRHRKGIWCMFAKKGRGNSVGLYYMTVKLPV